MDWSASHDKMNSYRCPLTYLSRVFMVRSCYDFLVSLMVPFYQSMSRDTSVPRIVIQDSSKDNQLLLTLNLNVQ
jgi:hypothetical protein